MNEFYTPEVTPGLATPEITHTDKKKVPDIGTIEGALEEIKRQEREENNGGAEEKRIYH